MNKLSVAILGAGNIAGGYDARRRPGECGIYSHAGAYLHHAGFELSTIFDINENRARQFKEDWRIGNLAASPEDIINGFHDVVSVCTPDRTHFPYVRDLLLNRSCKTIVVEKPLAQTERDYRLIMELVAKTGINVAVNFQRRYERAHQELRAAIENDVDSVLSVSGVYMKGLRHVGVTLIDSMLFLFGVPQAVLAVHRAWNREVEEYSYDFILYYERFIATVRTTDKESEFYSYHIFELDVLMRHRRCTFIDISQGLREAMVTDYAYGGVRVMNDRAAVIKPTTYDVSMNALAQYVFEVTTEQRAHEINTPADSFLGFKVMQAIEESYEYGLKQVRIAQ